MNNNIKQCKRCSKFLIEEEFTNHHCDPYFKDFRSIVVNWYLEPKKDENDDMVSLWKGLDGVIYRMIDCRHDPPHVPKYQFNPSNRPLTGEKNNRRLTKTL